MTTVNDVLATRMRLGWTQQQLADTLSNSRKRAAGRTVRGWESGEYAPPPYLKLALDRLIELHASRGPGRPRKKRRES